MSDLFCHVCSGSWAAYPNKALIICHNVAFSSPQDPSVSIDLVDLDSNPDPVGENAGYGADL